MIDGWDGLERRATGERRRGNGLHVTTPGGWSLAATGREVILTLLLMVLATFVYRGFEATAAQHHALTQSFDRVACVLSLDVADRIEAFQSGDPCRYLLGLRRRGPR